MSVNVAELTAWFKKADDILEDWVTSTDAMDSEAARAPQPPDAETAGPGETSTDE